MTGQIVHTRTSKFGKRFIAGKKIQEENPEEEKELNLLDTGTEIEVPAETISEIMERTGESDEKKILEKILELDTTDVDQICSSLENEE